MAWGGETNNNNNNNNDNDEDDDCDDNHDNHRNHYRRTTLPRPCSPLGLNSHDFLDQTDDVADVIGRVQVHVDSSKVALADIWDFAEQDVDSENDVLRPHAHTHTHRVEF